MEHSQNTLPAGLYIPASWQGLKQQCIQLAQFGGGIQVVHGDKGAGKTTFFQLLEQALADPDFIALTAPENFRAESFLSDLLWQLGLRPESGASFGELLAGLRSYVQSLQHESARVIVAVDDAHHIPDAFLGALISVLQGRSEPGLGMHFLLLGRPGLAQRLDAMGLLDIEVHDHSLPTLSSSETEQFLYAQGVGLASPLSADAISRIWSQSGGVPGRILQCLQDNIQAAEPDPVEKRTNQKPTEPSSDSESIWKQLPMAHVVALIVLAIFLVWAFLVKPEPEMEPKLETHNSRDVKPVALPVPPEPGREVSPTADAKQPKLPVATTSNAESPEAATQPQNVDNTIPSPDSNPNDSGSKTTNEEKSPPEEVSSRPAAEESVQSASPESNERASASAETLTQSSVSLRSQSSTSSAERYSDDEQTLMRYAPEGYVLQIMASSGGDNLRRFVNKQPNRENLKIYRAIKTGKTLYILVEGYYADKESAQAAVENLPTEQKRGGPWPKPLTRVQKEIKDAMR